MHLFAFEEGELERLSPEDEGAIPLQELIDRFPNAIFFMAELSTENV